MPIRLKLYELMMQNKGARNINRLSRKTKIRRAALVEYDRGSWISIKNKHLAQLCEHFQITDYNEILEFVPEPLSPRFQDEDDEDEDEGDDETSTDEKKTDT